MGSIKSWLIASSFVKDYMILSKKPLSCFVDYDFLRTSICILPILNSVSYISIFESTCALEVMMLFATLVTFFLFLFPTISYIRSMDIPARSIALISSSYILTSSLCSSSSERFFYFQILAPQKSKVSGRGFGSVSLGSTSSQFSLEYSTSSII